MMSEFRRCCMFLLLNAVAELLSVAGIGVTSKFVCPGDSVEAFQNIKMNRCNALVSLSIKGERNTLIAKWSVQNCTLNATVLPEYTERVFLDQNGTISIHNIHHFDQGTYVVFSQMDTMPKIYEVELIVMVAPTEDCRPNITRSENILIATLNTNQCGTPVASLYWKGNGSISNTDKTILKLTPGKETGAYFACIKGPALMCERNFTQQDYCSTFTIDGSKSPTISSETCNTTVVIAVNIVLCIVLSLTIIVIIMLIRKSSRKKNLKSLNDDEKQILGNHIAHSE